MVAGAAVVLTGAAASQPSSSGSVPAVATVSARPGKVLVVVLENHAIGSTLRLMPFLASQARGYAEASNYHAVRHPSLPNYLVLAGGSTFGVTDDKAPAAHRLAGSSVFGQVIAHGRTAKTYAEGMTRSCQQTNTGRYAVRHNPWAYFSSARERSLCLKNDVPAGTRTSGALHRDVAAGRLPTFSMLIPDLCHDAHDCRLATADAWLRGWLRQIEAGPDFRAGRLAVVVTFDEDDGLSGNRVLTAVMHPGRRGVVVTGRLDHYSLSATASRLAGGTALRRAAGTPNFLAAFGLR
jgi:acid phosphatase